MGYGFYINYVKYRIPTLPKDTDECIKKSTYYFHKIHSEVNYMLEKFIILWDSINKKRGYRWDVNPWVWVIEFEKV